ncbi:TonB-dependent receptor [Mesorhizobium sp. UC22_110]|uniref:TonB-dependent receptor n=1 Tax=unclassified Mesorhizobium TaxID=325217 RepID=UPI00366A6A16
MRLKAYRRSLACGAAALLSLPVAILPRPALSQEAAQAEQGATLLDRIVLTGRKRTEVEEKAPVSATVIQSKDISASGLDSGADIARKAPNTNFIDYTRFGDNYLNIRGVSTLGGPLNSFDSTVGFSIDGVPTSVIGFAPPLLDVEQVEVLRGPQGTTFGRNALAGAINVVSRPADGERDFRINTEIGSNGHAFVEGIAGGWISPDILAGRGAVRLQKYDGDIPNPYLDKDLGGAKIGAARGTVRYTPDATWTIDVSGSYSRDQRNNPAYLLYNHPDFPLSGEDVEPKNLRTIAQGTINIRKDFENVSFTSTTSYQDIGISNFGDFTDSYLYGPYLGLPPQFLFNPAADKVDSDEKERIFTQEFRLNSSESSDWQWVAGASYLRSDYDFHRKTATPFPTMNGTFDNKMTSETYAAFGDATVPLNEHWSISGGLRLAHDRQTFDGNYVTNGFPGTIPAFKQANEMSDTYMTGRAAIAYNWNADVMSYASIARGYASGGFEKTSQYAGFGMPSLKFDPAKSWTYEIGTKANLTEGIAVRGAVFYNDVRDGQLSGFDLATMRVFMTNQNFRSYGLELGGSTELTDGLELTGGIGYTKSEMVDVTPESMLTGAREGNRVPQVPEWTANLGLGYRLPGEALGVSGNFTANVSYQYVGTRVSDLADKEELEPYHTINARIGWENEKYGFYGFVNNLLDERPLAYSLTMAPGVRGVYIGRGRVFGAGATVKW